MSIQSIQKYHYTGCPEKIADVVSTGFVNHFVSTTAKTFITLYIFSRLFIFTVVKHASHFLFKCLEITVHVFLNLSESVKIKKGI